MKHRGQNVPRFGEAQATAWLSWLARGMQTHGQTIILIEQLQPSWLSTRRQRWVYIFTSRLIWGAVVGLIFGLIFGLIGGLFSSLIFGLIFGLLVGLIGGLIFGLIGGLIDVVRFARNHSHSAQNASATLRQIIAGTLLYGLIGALSGGLIGRLSGGLIFGLLVGLIGGLSGGLLVGLLFGPFWTLRSFGRNSRNEIQTVETIRFSWAYVPKGIVNGLIFGLLVGLLSGLLVGLLGGLSGGLLGGLLGGLSGGLLGGLIFWLLVGLSGGLLVGLMSCFRPGIRELKTIPNQGIRLSLRSASLMGGVGGLALGLIVGLWGGWTAGLAYGALGGLCIGLWYGGLDVLQHYIVRTLLWRAGAMPWDYARFLDYAAEDLSFLQKVGGGYIFVHRYLLEYFAAMELPGQPAASDRHDVSQPAGRAVDSV